MLTVYESNKYQFRTHSLCEVGDTPLEMLLLFLMAFGVHGKTPVSSFSLLTTYADPGGRNLWLKHTMVFGVPTSFYAAEGHLP